MKRLSDNKCPDCYVYSLEQMDNIRCEYSATRYRCQKCGKSFAIHIDDDEDVKKFKEIYIAKF